MKNNMMQKIFKTIKKRKIVSGIAIFVLLMGGYFGLKALKGNSNEARYVLAAVEKGNLIMLARLNPQVREASSVGGSQSFNYELRPKPHEKERLKIS